MRSTVPHPRLDLRLVLASAVAACLSAACVTSGAHERVVSERDALALAKRNLEEQVRLLTIANDSLDDQAAELLDEREDLFLTRSGLEQQLSAARTSEERLSGSLARREQELAVTAAALAQQNQNVSELQGTYDGLVGDLEAEVAAGQIRIEQLEEGLRVGLSQEILFESGSARLSSGGEEVLRKVATRLVGQPYQIAVQGHSDDQAIRRKLAQRYPSNWELAGARAASVVRVFLDAGIDGRRLAAVSFGPYRPVADNATAEGREQNRRIEVRLRPERSGAEPVDETPIATPDTGPGPSDTGG